MYKVKYIIQLHSGMSALSSDDMWVKKELELPFPPSKDIEIHLGDIEQDGDKQICWYPDEQMFRVYSEDKELYDHIVASHFKYDQGYVTRRFSEMVQQYLDDGWEVEED